MKEGLSKTKSIFKFMLACAIFLGNSAFNMPVYAENTGLTEGGGGLI